MKTRRPPSGPKLCAHGQFATLANDVTSAASDEFATEGVFDLNRSSESGQNLLCKSNYDPFGSLPSLMSVISHKDNPDLIYTG